jgi:transposase
VHGRQVLTGDLFLFVGRDRRRAKVLYFDSTGMCLFAKRLEKGQFSAAWQRAKSHSGYEMTLSKLADSLTRRCVASSPRVRLAAGLHPTKAPETLPTRR